MEMGSELKLRNQLFSELFNSLRTVKDFFKKGRNHILFKTKINLFFLVNLLHLKCILCLFVVTKKIDILLIKLVFQHPAGRLFFVKIMT